MFALIVSIKDNHMMKTINANKLSFNLLKKITLIICISFFLVGFGSIHRAKMYSKQNIINLSKEALNEVLYVVANVNSVLMQQMRVYTKFDKITSVSKNPIVIQKKLIEIRNSRYKDFLSISYIDYQSGKEYSDSGSIIDISSCNYYKRLLKNRKNNKANQMYTEEIENNIYGICKEPDVFDNEGYTYGCYIGKVSIDYIQRFLNKLKGTTLDSELGFPVIISKSSKLICSPERDKLYNYSFSNWKPSKNILDYVLDPKDVDSNGKKIIIDGCCFINEKKYSVVIGVFPKTEWSLAIITPYDVFDKSANQTIIYIIIFAVLATVLSNFIIIQIFRYEFRPLGELNLKFKEIAAGEADLTKRINIKRQRKTEIGDIQIAFNEYLSQLQNMIKDVAKSKDELLDVFEGLSSAIIKIKKEHKKINETLDLLDKSENKEKILDNGLRKLDNASANLDFLIPELENILNELYMPVGKLSSSVEGFKY